MADTPAPRTPSLLARALDSDIFYSFRRSKLTMVAAAIVFVLLMMALLAPVLVVQNPFDPAQLELINSRISRHTSRRLPSLSVPSRKSRSACRSAGTISSSKVAGRPF